MLNITPDIAADNRARRKLFLVVAVVSTVLIAILAWVVLRSSNSAVSGPPPLEGALRPGSPDFEKYRKQIFLDKPEADEAARPLGDIVMTLRTTVRNFTDKTINGLEIRAAVVDSERQPVKERTVNVIPSRTPELEPNKTLPVAVFLEGIRKDADRADIKMEVTAIRFK